MERVEDNGEAGEPAQQRGPAVGGRRTRLRIGLDGRPPSRKNIRIRVLNYSTKQDQLG